MAAAFAEWTDRPPARPPHADDPDYGMPGRCRIAGHTATWMTSPTPATGPPGGATPDNAGKDQTQMWMQNGI